MEAEHRSSHEQLAPEPSCGRMRAAHHASRRPFRLLERRYGLAEIVQSCAVGFVERLGIMRRAGSSSSSMTGAGTGATAGELQSE